VAQLSTLGVKMDTITQVSFYGAFILSPIVFIWTMWKFRHLGFAIRFLVSILFSGATFASLFILAVSIFFRDGMGPGMISTYGIQGFENCWTGILSAFIAGVVPSVLGILLVRRATRPSIEKLSYDA
jgi:glucan phosphoethanolaminetransferase (alkaline phosphatase superfamily)